MVRIVIEVENVIIVMVIDIDECSLSTDRCDQSCQNTVGSYTCSCNAGYTLDGNGQTCDGMA